MMLRPDFHAGEFAWRPPHRLELTPFPNPYGNGVKVGCAFKGIRDEIYLPMMNVKIKESCFAHI